jgi:hypothetical protein
MSWFNNLGTLTKLQRCGLGRTGHRDEDSASTEQTLDAAALSLQRIPVPVYRLNTGAARHGEP